MKMILHVAATLAVAAHFLAGCGSGSESGGGPSGSCAGAPLPAGLGAIYAEEQARLGWSAPEPLVYFAPSERPTWESQLANDPARDWCIAGTIVECPECRRGWSCSRGEYRGFTEGCPVVVVADMAADREDLFRHEAVHHLVFERTGDPDAGHVGGWW